MANTNVPFKRMENQAEITNYRNDREGKLIRVSALHGPGAGGLTKATIILWTAYIGMPALDIGVVSCTLKQQRRAQCWEKI